MTGALLGKLQSSIAAEKIVFSVDKLVTPNYLLFISVRLMDSLFFYRGKGEGGTLHCKLYWYPIH